MSEEIKRLQEHVIREFTTPLTQEVYRREAHKGLWPSEAAIINKYFQPGSTVLDVGCGTGRTTIPLHRLGYQVVGIDITPAMIATARAVAEEDGLAIKYEVGDATRLKYADGSFDDALFSFNGWAQIPGVANRFAALKEIYRVLRPGGFYIFTTHLRDVMRLSQRPFWIKQWIRGSLLKPLGWPVEETEYGDRFFNRIAEVEDPELKRKWANTRQRQYVHISSDRAVQSLIRAAGFELVERLRGNAIAPDDPPSSPMFYVCRRPPISPPAARTSE